MKRWSPIILAGMFYCLGVILGPRMPFGSKGYMDISIVNHAGQPIKSVCIIPEELKSTINQREEKALRYYVAGETSYRLRVKFEDGKEIEGGAGYVESGYRAIEQVTDEKIKTIIRLR